MLVLGFKIGLLSEDKKRIEVFFFFFLLLRTREISLSSLKVNSLSHSQFLYVIACFPRTIIEQYLIKRVRICLWWFLVVSLFVRVRDAAEQSSILQSSAARIRWRWPRRRVRQEGIRWRQAQGQQWEPLGS